MTKLQTFNYGAAPIRTVQKDGEPWFVLKDVCEILGLGSPHKVFDRLDDDERGRNQIPTLGGKQEMACINESGLYNVILRSDKPEAKPFRKWVTAEVLPTIRKTGGYVNDEDAFIQTYLPNADEATRDMFRNTLKTVRQLNAKIEQDKPKVLFADAVATAKSSILVGELAKLLNQNGVQIGQNRLFAWLREHGYLIRRAGSDYNMPTQRSMEMGLFEIKETAIPHADGHVTTNKTPKVTGKGQQYFINLFLTKS